MNIKTTIFLSFLLLFVSCKNTKTTNYDLLITREKHSFKIEEMDPEHIEISSSLAYGKAMKLNHHEDWAQVLNGKEDLDNELWRFADRKTDKIKEVFLAPYYSMFTYNMLERMKAPEMAIIHPDCPVTTRYLLMVIMENGIPLFGCVHPQ